MNRTRTATREAAQDTVRRLSETGSETSLLKSILAWLELEPGIVAFRNNTGAFRSHGHMRRFGLGVGSADVIAILAPYGRIVALECKTVTKQSPDQKAWESVVTGMGGYYAVVHSIEEARAAIAAARCRTHASK